MFSMLDKNFVIFFLFSSEKIDFDMLKSISWEKISSVYRLLNLPREWYRFKFQHYVFNPCPAKPRYILLLQTV